MQKISTIVVEDDDIFRESLKEILAAFSEIDIVGEAADIESARKLIKSKKPELLFFDVDLKGENMLDHYKSLVDENAKVIFITGSDAFALKAFEVRAFDYIVKPINLKRLAETIEKVINDKQEKTAGNNQSNERYTMDNSILLNFNQKLSFVKITAIKAIVSVGNYTKVFTEEDKMAMTYNSLIEWEAKLPDAFFQRIHRSTIINISFVEKIVKWGQDSGKAHIINMPEPFDISRNYFSLIRNKYKI